MRALLTRGAGVDGLVEEGFSPLMVACENGHLEIVRTLLDKRAQVNTIGEDGSSALMLA